MGFQDLTLDDYSSMSGWISISCWLVVYSPQIIDNYQLKSGEGLSVAFVVLWLAGDITNLIGGAMAHLLPTMIILAVYYTVCDLILLFQVYYYRRRTARLPPPNPENQPLLNGRKLSTTTPPPKPFLPPSLQYPLLALSVIFAGVGMWYISTLTVSHPSTGGPIPPVKHHHGAHKSHTPFNLLGNSDKGGVELEWKSQVLGYASAVLYLGSRVPQIVHNVKTRCEGLSLAMFFFSISGNLTYVASILLKSVEPTYVLANASWLAGSGLTVFLDLFVLAQFAYFSWQDKKAAENAVFIDGEEVRDD